MASILRYAILLNGPAFPAHHVFSPSFPLNSQSLSEVSSLSSDMQPPLSPVHLDEYSSTGILPGALAMDSAVERHMLIRNTWMLRKRNHNGTGWAMMG